MKEFDFTSSFGKNININRVLLQSHSRCFDGSGSNDKAENKIRSYDSEVNDKNSSGGINKDHKHIF